MQFEYDPQKSRSNKTKHGIDFEEAKALWSDADRLEIPAKSMDEPRTMLIGRILRNIWAAIFTMRGEAVRLISCRRARTEEVDLYEQAKK